MMGMGGGMGRMMGAKSVLISETATAKAATQQQISKTSPEPSVTEQIEQIKKILDWLLEIKDEVDEDTWLSLTTTLEEMLKELEADL